MIEIRHTTYTPIACDAYSTLEEAIVRKRRLRLTWAEDNAVHSEIVTPLDLETARGEEFLLCHMQTGGVRRRLDRRRQWERA